MWIMNSKSVCEMGVVDKYRTAERLSSFLFTWNNMHQIDSFEYCHNNLLWLATDDIRYNADLHADFSLPMWDIIYTVMFLHSAHKELTLWNDVNFDHIILG